MKTKEKKRKQQRPQMSYWQSCQLRALVQYGNVTIKEIMTDKRQFAGFQCFSQATLYRHAKYPLDGRDPVDKRKFNPGRPQLLDGRDYRAVRRQLKVLRALEGTFTSSRLQASIPKLATSISNTTLRRALQKMGYGYRRTRKKGLLKKQDLNKRLKFARRIKKLGLGLDFWKKGISFYLDSVGFVYKKNPLDQARTPTAREWRLPGEGLSYGCTTKGKKEGSTQKKFLVAISYNKGVVLCEEYEKLNGRKYSRMVKKFFPLAFNISVNPKSKRLLQDGCPIQNSKRARQALDRIGAHVFCIPARSPDTNPIENFFHLVGKELRQQAIESGITEESKEEFVARVKKMLLEYPAEKIDAIIESMDKRMEQIIKARGQRIKY